MKSGPLALLAASDVLALGIARSGSSGNYTCSAMADRTGVGSENRPITHVNWFDAARFSNWMENGQPTRAQTGATTENGAYTLNGATSELGKALAVSSSLI